MFTVKIVNQDQDNATLFQWEKIQSHGPLSHHFETLKQYEIDRADDEVKDMCKDYYAYIGDGNGHEYWIAIGDDCFVTDASGKTVLIHRSP